MPETCDSALPLSKWAGFNGLENSNVVSVVTIAVALIADAIFQVWLCVFYG